MLIFVGLDKKGISGSGVSVRIPGSRLEGGFGPGGCVLSQGITALLSEHIDSRAGAESAVCLI